MENADAGNFKALMASVADMYGKELSAPVLKIWWHSLKRFDFSAVNSALMDYIADPDAGVYMPKPADVVARLEGSGEQIKVINQSNANSYWQMIYSNLHKAQPPEFDDPDVMVAIRQIGGWRSLSMDRLENMVFRSKSFINAYLTIKEAARVAQKNPAVAGLMSKEVAQQSLSNIYKGISQRAEE